MSKEKQPLPGMDKSEWLQAESDVLFSEGKKTGSIEMSLEGLGKGIEAVDEGISELETRLTELENDTSLDDAMWEAILPLYGYLFPGQSRPETVQECITLCQEALGEKK